MTVRPAKTQISLGMCPVWSESSLSAWRKLGSLATHWVHSEDSDHFVGFVMSRLIYLFHVSPYNAVKIQIFGHQKQIAGIILKFEQCNLNIQ